MKKYFLPLLTLALVTGFTGCLKDKGFENQDYGIQITDQPGISLPWATQTDPTLISLSVSTSVQIVSAPTVSLDAEQAAPQDIHVNLVPNPTLVADYNTSSGNTWKIMPATNFTIPSLKVTILKGQKISALKINILTTTGLDFSSIYGFGFSIASVDEPGYKIASTFKNVVFGINVSNPYAGDYKTTGYVFHPSAPRALNDEKYLSTVSANRCRAGIGDLYGAGYYFDFDVAGTVLNNWAGVNATPPVPGSGFMSADNPGGTIYAPLAPGGSSGYTSTIYNNTYTAATKTFLMHYGYAVGGNGQNTYTRQFYEKWVKK